MTNYPSDDDLTTTGPHTVGSSFDVAHNNDVGVDDDDNNKRRLLTPIVGFNEKELDKIKSARYTKPSDLELLGMDASDTLKMFRGSQDKFLLAMVQRLEIYATYLYNEGPINPFNTIIEMKRYNSKSVSKRIECRLLDS